MSVDFSNVTGISDRIGNIVKITDSLGKVLWNAVKMANLTITSFWDGMDGDTARITVNSPSPFAPNPNEPNNKVTSWTAYVYDLFDQQNRTIKIPVGSTIECYINRDKDNADSYIKLNDVNMVTGEGTYIYTVIGDATIDVSEDYIQGDFGVITITGAVSYISFTMNDETYQAIEGMSWKAWFASSYNTTGETEGTITDANGNEVSMDSVIVDGTVYEVGFAPTGAVVTITQDVCGIKPGINAQYASVTIDGVTYDGSQTVYLTVPIGTKITCFSRGGNIYVNSGSIDKSSYEFTYEFTVQKDTTVAVGTATVMTTTGNVRIIDDAPIVFFVRANLTTYGWCENGSTWNDLDGTNVGTIATAITDGKVYTTVGTSTYRIQFNGVDVKPTDTIVHTAYYTTIKV